MKICERRSLIELTFTREQPLTFEVNGVHLFPPEFFACADTERGTRRQLDRYFDDPQLVCHQMIYLTARPLVPCVSFGPEKQIVRWMGQYSLTALSEAKEILVLAGDASGCLRWHLLVPHARGKNYHLLR